ncbi:hypothetical protein FHR32_005564 [Streptosporangium album]|uniref:Uncharacterized protein n=1 Tax=Streptosporangium album TaxID=47479 RepID=A0A7W7WB77_9ACTN|nr:hypothetical protein [Streptosporangium album]
MYTYGDWAPEVALIEAMILVLEAGVVPGVDASPAGAVGGPSTVASSAERALSAYPEFCA